MTPLQTIFVAVCMGWMCFVTPFVLFALGRSGQLSEKEGGDG